MFNENPLKEDAKTIVQSDTCKQLIAFLTQIKIENSNIIFAFSKTLLKCVEPHLINMSEEAIEALIYLALVYNKKN